MQTNYELVGNFHKLFGHPVATEYVQDAFVSNPKLVNFRLNLIQEEFNEFKDAVHQHDMKEMIDALGDMLFVIYGTGQALGVDLDDVFRRVYDSNMTKVCSTESEAKETVASYAKQGIVTNYRLTDCNRYAVYNVETSKILKSINFTLPDFTPWTTDVTDEIHRLRLVELNEE